MPTTSTERLPLRIGLGFDSHRLATGGPLRIGGIDVDCDLHLVGHSDADVVLHAITDAILSAAMLPDIGELFPNTDPANAGRNSADFLREAMMQAKDLGFELINVDCVVRLERPKLSPHKDAMRRRIADVLQIDMEQVGIKAKTGEQTGDIGAGRIAEAHCVALLQRTAAPKNQGSCGIHESL